MSHQFDLHHSSSPNYITPRISS